MIYINYVSNNIKGLKMSETIKVGIIGTGFGQKVQIPGFLNVDEYELVAVAGQNYAKTIQVSEKFGIPKAYKSWSELINDPTIDLVSIVTPVYYHYEMVMETIATGKDVLCEKPMAIDEQQAYEMWDFLEKEDRVGMINHEFRQLPEWRFFRDFVAEGNLGEEFEVNIVYSTYTRLPFTGRLWNWWSSSLMGGGIWGALGSHFIDFIRWVFGEFQGITGRLVTKVHSRPDPITHQPRPVTSDDTFHAVFQLTSGVEGTINGSVVRHGKGGTIIEAYGSEASIKIDWDRTVWTAKKDQPWQKIKIPDKYALRPIKEGENYLQPAFEVLISQLREGIKKRISPSPSFEDGYEVQKVLDALRYSHETGQWVVIN